jgi:hypothetical protein
MDWGVELLLVKTDRDGFATGLLGSQQTGVPLPLAAVPSPSQKPWASGYQKRYSKPPGKVPSSGISISPATAHDEVKRVERCHDVAGEDHR